MWVHAGLIAQVGVGSSVGECERGGGGEGKVESGMGGIEGASACFGW